MPEKVVKAYKSCVGSAWAAKAAKKYGKTKEQFCRGYAVNKTGQEWVQHSWAGSKKEERFLLVYDVYIDAVELSETSDLIITGISITEDYLDKEDIIKYHKYKIGNKVLFNHFHPVKDEVEIDGKSYTFPVYGRIIDSWIETVLIPSEDGEGTVEKLANLVKIQLFGFTESHRAMQELIRKHFEAGDPLSLSDMFIRYHNKDGKTLYLWNEETSITPDPVCGACKLIDNVMLSKLNGDMNMSTELTGTDTTEAVTTEPVESTELAKDTKTSGQDGVEPGAKVTELEQVIVKMNGLVEAQKNKITDLEKTLLAKGEELTALSKSYKIEIEFLTVKKPLLNAISTILGSRWDKDAELQKKYEGMTIEALQVQKELLSEVEKQKDAVEKIPVQAEPAPKVTETDEKKFKKDFLTEATDQLMETAKKDSINSLFK